MTQHAATSLPKGCDVLIVGAGAYGLSTAWFLANKMPGGRIVVVDRSDFAGNGTGRCIGGFRTQWGHSSNILMARESVQFFEEAAQLLDYPNGIELKQDGYLLLAWDQPTLQRFESVQAVQHHYGVRSALLSPEEALRISPLVNPEGLIGASFCERDGTLSPFRLLDALLTAVRRQGVQLFFGTELRDLRTHGDGFIGTCNEQEIAAEKVVLCTDWEVNKHARMVGTEVPVRSVPVEIMVSEPTRPMLGPVHISMRHNMAINQMMRGSIVINHGKARGEGAPARVQPDWIEDAARGATEVVPALDAVKILRAWAGEISVTPDMQPILDRTEVNNLFVAVSAYKGLMTAPAAGRLMADFVLADDLPEDPIAPFVSLSRFRTGQLVREPMTNGARLD